MKTVKMGIFGLGRGSYFYDNIMLNNGEVVAVCDKDESRIEEAKKLLGNSVKGYTDFDSFIDHEGLEAVMLCNYFHEHAAYAIRALDKNIHVLSECASNGTMAEGVALVRAAQKSKAHYMISENYPFMKFNREMKQIHDGGTLGKIMYATGEYNHPVDPYDNETLLGLMPYATHWRNMLPRTYYITHSLAPLMYITGATPKRVTAMPVYLPFPEDSLMTVRVQDRAAIVNILNDDDSVFTVTGCAAFGAHGNYYRLCGERGQVQNVLDKEVKILLRYNKWETPENTENYNLYVPRVEDKDDALIEKAGHGGGDFIVVREFFECIRKNRRPIMDEYFATTMASVAMLSHRSMLEGGAPYDIPDFRKEEDRIKYENDRLSPFFGSDGSEPTVACESHENHISYEESEAIYARIVEQMKKSKEK